MAEEKKTVNFRGQEVPIVPVPYEDIFTDITDIGKAGANVGINLLNTPPFYLIYLLTEQSLLQKN